MTHSGVEYVAIGRRGHSLQHGRGHFKGSPPSVSLAGALMAADELVA